MASKLMEISQSDRLSELKAFDDTKAGVKGLVDGGVTAVPRIFHDPAADSSPRHDVTGSRVPVIDLAAARPELVAQVTAAAETVGFFQIVNHGVPGEILAATLASVRAFHEEPVEAKAPYYTRDPTRLVRYLSNFHLFTSPSANWRDTLFVDVSSAAPEDVPPACRGALMECSAKVNNLGATLLELLFEAMAQHRGFMDHDAGGLYGVGLSSVTGNYYPPCPQPHLTMGTTRHSDPSFLTIVFQDGVGGLQVLVDDEGGGGGSWVDVPPVPGALVVNIGDFLQLMSNDRFKSVEHRVLAMAASPRVSVAFFFKSNGGGRVYGPIVNSAVNEQPRYRNMTVEEFMDNLRNKGLDGRSALEHFRL